MKKYIKIFFKLMFVLIISYTFANNVLLAGVYAYGLANDSQPLGMYLPLTLLTNVFTVIYAYTRSLKF